MGMTDPIADMLTRIRNAHLALHKEVSVPSSKMKEAIAAILKQEGYVDDVTVEDRNINIQLKYFKGKPAIEGLKRMSKPGRRPTKSPACRTASASASCPLRTGCSLATRLTR